MISIIVVGRADNHTGDFTGRLLQTAKFNSRALIDAEIEHQFVFVEWNSPPPLVGTVAQRYVQEVPNSIAYVVGPKWHARVCDNPNMVIMEFFAKNVALLRCKTPVALCMNADILFGPDTVKLLAGWRGCSKKTMYRVLARKDIKSDRVYEHVNELEDPSIIVKEWKSVPPAFTQGAGDFQMALTSYWHDLRGFDETIRWAKIHKDHRMCTQVIAHGGKLVATASCYHLYHKSSYVNQKAFPRHAPWGPEYKPSNWMPYRNPDNWGLSRAKMFYVAGTWLLLPPKGMRKIPPLAQKPKPVGR